MSARNDEIRSAALAHVQRLRAVWGDSVPESELAKGFVVLGERILLKGQQGIFKPKQLSDGPLTIMSTLGSRYEDELLEEANRVRYDFAPRTGEHDNVGMKRLMAARKPVILCAFHHAAYDPDILRIDPEYRIKVEREWV